MPRRCPPECNYMRTAQTICQVFWFSYIRPEYRNVIFFFHSLVIFGFCDPTSLRVSPIRRQNPPNWIQHNPSGDPPTCRRVTGVLSSPAGPCGLSRLDRLSSIFPFFLRKEGFTPPFIPPRGVPNRRLGTAHSYSPRRRTSTNT